jgi:hypothetical protein
MNVSMTRRQQKRDPRAPANPALQSDEAIKIYAGKHPADHQLGRSRKSKEQIVEIIGVSITGDSSVRNANLDLLRAIAICSVVAYHMILMSPTPLPNLSRYTYSLY